MYSYSYTEQHGDSLKIDLIWLDIYLEESHTNIHVYGMLLTLRGQTQRRRCHVQPELPGVINTKKTILTLKIVIHK
jgi:hypothetical protein